MNPIRKSKAAPATGEVPEEQAHGAANLGTNPPARPGKPWMIFGICVFLLAIVWVVFGQTTGFDFVNFDDGQYVTENPQVTAGLTKQGILSAFSSHATDNWVPLTTISHMLDCQIYDLAAGGHHFTNVLLHGASTILLFLTLHRMTRAMWRSAFVGAIFAIHPLRAESVAWISERKDVLCGVFFMLTLWAYAGYARNPKSLMRNLAALFFAALALMSKPVAVTLPFVLLLLDYWPLGRFEENTTGRPRLWQIMRLAAEKIPFLTLSIASCLPTILTERQGITMTTMVPIPLRIENAIVSTVVYIGELFYPSKLAAFYYYPITGIPFLKVGVALIFLGAISFAVFYWRRNHPYLLVGWFWYLVMLVPVIGLVQVGSQAHADRHTYLSEIGLCLLLTWLVADWCARLPRRELVLGVLCPGVIIVLIFCAHTQVSYWRNGGTLWTHAIACDPYDVRAYYDLANYLDQKKDLEGAVKNYETAIRIDPKLVGAHNNLGIILAARGDLDDAISQYEMAIALDANYAVAHYNLGGALLQRGQTNQAIVEFQDALSIDPAHSEVRNNADLALPDVPAKQMKTNYAQFHYSLGLALETEGQLAGAIAQYREALALNPNHDASYSLALALVKTGNVEEGIQQFQNALRNNSDDAKTHNNFGIALRKAGRLDDAIVQYQEALKINPDYAQAHYNLGNAFFQKGQINDAILQYQSALQIMPANQMLQRNLAHAIWLLATSTDASGRNGTNAVAFAQTANDLAGGNNPMILRVLAAAYAECGNFAAAIETGKKAITLADEQQNPALQSALQQDTSRYEAGSPVRADPANADGW
jgi:tetratricopeptide (TPR) repeat protein